MNHSDDTAASRSTSVAADTANPDRWPKDAARFPATDMPIRLVILLIAIALPRTVLADLDIVPPESGVLYYLLALVPFAAWLAVATTRRSRRPFLDFVILGILYGLSLIVVHQALWDVGTSLGHQPPDSALAFADQFSSDWREFALRAYTSGIAMFIGLGIGLTAALAAVVANALRSRRAHRIKER